MKKHKKIDDKFIPIVLVAIIVFLWEIIVDFKWIERYILPSPSDVIKALIVNFKTIMMHSKVTLIEGVIGLFVAIVISFLIAAAMDRMALLKKAIYPLLVASQTVPIIVIAPLIAMWFGFGITPKIFVVVLVCFFPITISLSDGLESVDDELVDLLKTMGASSIQIFKKVKVPYALQYFFSGLKIAATYSIMGAVIGEWLGGKSGLGVYMLRARHSFLLDQVFASILVIVALSMFVFYIISIVQKILMPWTNLKEEKR
ncbi:MAG: ABC transporter permease [Clostridiales bacterium]|nr:ABC transporter permease [Clostridiales bacterium]